MYPNVVSEATTLDMVLAGSSLARFGDGELNLCARGHAKLQVYRETLSERLQGILKDSGRCLVGIPNINSATPKVKFWSRYAQTDRLLTQRQYVSAFVTRPDSAPWIDTADYWQKVESLWRGRDVTLVRGYREVPDRSGSAQRVQRARDHSAESGCVGGLRGPVGAHRDT